MCQSFDKCGLREVGHCRDFFMVVGQLESRLTWVLKRGFLEGTVQFSKYKFLRERSVEALSVAAQMRARGSSVLSALSLYI